MRAALTVRADQARIDSRLRQERRRVLRSVRFGLDSASRRLEQDLEQATKRAVRGKLWRAWSRKLFPERGLSSNPAALVFPRGGERTRSAMRAFAFGATIRSARGGWLAIPLPAAGRSGRKRPTPEEFEKRIGARLVFVPLKSGLALLVRPTLPGLRRTINGRPVASDPVFVLVRKTRIRAGFSIPAALSKVNRRFLQAYSDRYRTLKGGDDAAQ
ncbi:hypothetical protein JCM17846_18510 [Iodidimonas nitroreducens]|uniref:Uncharacterized protein n=1 Tax=Iodidimonas nitroreducens TaxID=1236968 RepID=A0A5A7NAW3_9PROT|nr:DUF6441 family protein [Iodidimonas nitroreducens]GAK33251.1 hypothetical protein AQ1_01138 [alpha proteobacterium Q-1]GER04169.1 hypothetical protein JCM17846_18510 [Iodidimonas nitroreducens]